MTQPQLGSFESIPLSLIRPSLTNPRKHFDDLAMQELTRSVQEMGVTQPIVLRPVNEANDDTMLAYYEIVCGERRFRAATAAGLQGMPAIVRELSDADAADMQMVENLQRADLHPVEEAEGFRVLIAHGATPEEIARKSGKKLSHVVQIIKLLDLEVLAKQLFSEGHMSLDHALQLARLTPKDQERALCFLLRIHDSEISKKQPVADAIAKRLQPKEDFWNEEDHVDPEWARRQNEIRRSKRLVEATAVELKDWITSHVLLQLTNASWMLHDSTLVPIAGACTDCPKRTGANVALFEDLVSDTDTCTDPTCFSAKQAAQAKRVMDAAKESGAPVLKISSKTSHQKMEQPAIEVKKGATTVTKATVKKGQWVDAREGECNFTVQAVVQDGPDKGKVTHVCANQNCKVHKHSVDRPQNQSRGRISPEKEAEERAKRLDAFECELKIRAQMLCELRDQVTPNAEMLRQAVSRLIDKQFARGGYPVVARAYDLELPPHGDEYTWDWQARAGKLLQARVEKIHSIPALIQMLFDLWWGNLLEVYEHGDQKQDRARVVKLVEEQGVDTADIIQRITAEHNAPKLELQAQSAPEPKADKKKLTAAEQATRKAAAAKKFTGKKNAAKKAAKKVGA